MNFYIDFEATQPEQEIISIGAVAENGATFYSLVQPKHSVVSSFITKLTGITNEDVAKAESIDEVFNKFYIWLYLQEHDLTKWNFYSYGKDDITFLKNSLIKTTSETHLIVASVIIATMKDYSQNVCKYFCCQSTSLLHAYNYLHNIETTQKHNALEDAEMLAKIASKIDGTSPMAYCPFNKKFSKEDEEFEWPVGKVITRTLGKQPKIREYVDLRSAIEWIIDTTIGKKARPNTSRKKMAQKILKSIEENKKYHNYMWEIIKEEE